MKCSKCGKSIENDWKCCPSCGNLINDNKEGSIRNGSRMYIILFTLFLVLCIICFFIYRYTYNNDILNISIILGTLSILFIVAGRMNYQNDKTIKNVSRIVFIIIGIIFVLLFLFYTYIMIYFINNCNGLFAN